MDYLKQRYARILLACMAATIALLVLLPRIDLYVSSLFFVDGAFPAAQVMWTRVLHAGLTYTLWTCMAVLVAIYGLDKLRNRTSRRLSGRTISYLLIVLILGPGLIVNTVLKDHFGRARPRDVVQFGGTAHFTPAFVITDQCDRNCSFSSGEAAGGFFALAFARAFSRRRAAIAAAIAFGCIVSIARIAAGAHFFSDAVVSFFVVLLVSEVSYHYLLRSPAAPAASRTA